MCVQFVHQEAAQRKPCESFVMLVIKVESKFREFLAGVDFLLREMCTFDNMLVVYIISQDVRIFERNIIRRSLFYTFFYKKHEAEIRQKI